jgi:hypothetical protein
MRDRFKDNGFRTTTFERLSEVMCANFRQALRRPALWRVVLFRGFTTLSTALLNHRRHNPPCAIIRMP